jgi:hypothetical protein
LLTIAPPADPMTDPLARLFGTPARVKLLRLFLFNPRQHATIAEAAARAQIDLELARSEIKLFVTIGLCKFLGRRSGNRYGLSGDFRYLAALQALLLNAPALGDDMYERLRSTGSIKLIIVAGVFVGEWDGQLDLLVIGDRVEARKLRTKIRSLESELGKELRYALLNTQDFFYRLNMSDKLVRDVMDYPHAIVYDRLNIGLK